MTGSLLLTSAALLFGAPGEPAEAPSLWSRPELTGRWGGARDALEDAGIDVQVTYLAGVWANVLGGIETGARYEGFATWELDLDLEALVSWRGASFFVNGYAYHGGQPSGQLVGLFAPRTLSGNEAADSVRIFEIGLAQTFFGGRLTLEVGQLIADEDFCVVASGSELMNGTFGFLGTGRTDPIIPFYPLASLGTYAELDTPDGVWELRSGFYTAAIGRDVEQNIGFDYRFDNGVSGLMELRYHAVTDSADTVLALGFLSSTAELETYRADDRTATRRGLFGAWVTLDHHFVPQPEDVGMGGFLRAYGSPTDDRSPIRFYWDVGFRLTHPFHHGLRNSLSMGLSQTLFSEPFRESRRASGVPPSQTETLFEVTYRVKATGWLFIQPDVQWVISPLAAPDNAWVLGLRSILRL